MKRSLTTIIYLLITLTVFLIAVIPGCSHNASLIPEDAIRESRLPAIAPDYTDIVIPPSIAPMNFVIREEGKKYVVAIYSVHGDTISIATDNPAIEIPIESWHNLLDVNKGETLSIDVGVESTDGSWRRFETITNTISDDDIDSYVMYRRLKPLHNYWRTMRIMERNITSFDESLVFGNAGIDHGCCNCHTTLGNNPETMLIHTRSSLGAAMLLVRNGKVAGVNSRTPFKAPIAYSSIHPSGKWVAFSVNRVKQYFHAAGDEVREVIDLDSSLGLYSVETNELLAISPELTLRDRLETYPAWSPDGKYLYYCSAALPWSEEEKNVADTDITLPPGYKNIRYDLMRIPFNSGDATWGTPEVLVSSEVTGKSITQPKVSPDSRFVVFSMADYGCFPTYQPSCDLYMLNVETGEYLPLPSNSDRCDSWHSWSTNGRWLIFSSKRSDGIFARLYFVHCDSEGKTGKAFVLPQKNPAMYDSFLDTYNVPEFSIAPVAVTNKDFASANAALEDINGIDVAVTTATPQAPKADDIRKQ